ncbi:MAG TPA: hypothetical protein VNI20_06680 [Fimbriimonadaceae bacterium]|nr:hypothetical protein [Fimbriimonadaceae bacterium]
MERQERMRKNGFTIAIAGLAVAALSLIPPLTPKQGFPWLLILGSFVYLPGAFMVLVSSKGPDAKLIMGKLRFIRLGFIAIFALVVWQMFSR